MHVELLVVPDCPNEAPARALLRAALEALGLTGETFTTTVIHTQELAEKRAFTGSPTFLIDGQDPFAERGREPGLTCRIYLNDGAPGGVPELSALLPALRRAATG